MKFSELEYCRPDLAKLELELVACIAKLASPESSLEQQVEAILVANTLRKTYQSQQTLARIRHSINSLDPIYHEEQKFYDQHDPKIQDLVVQLYHAVVNSPHHAGLAQRFGDEFMATAKRSAKTSSLQVLPLLEEENRLVSEYQQLMAAVRVDFEGKQYNLSQFGRFNQSPNRETRIAAQTALATAMTNNRPAFDSLYDQLVQLRVKIAQELGYSNFIELCYDRMNRGGYNQKDVGVFREAIKKYVVPLATEFVQEQQKRLELDHLYFYDLPISYPNGNPEPTGTVQQQIDHASKMYAELSPETKEFWEFMVKHELMDLPARDGKFPGGYATMLFDTKMPFIFANFNGTSDDIGVLTHEVGHTFQAYCSKDFELIEDVWPTLEACEIHSESMEFLTWPWMDLFFADRTKDFKYDAVTRLLRFLPYAACVDHFQEEVYSNPNLEPKERCQRWRELEKIYLPHKDYAGFDYYEQGCFWFMQRHIFVNPFYYIDYALARVCAIQFWLESERDFKQAWQRYLGLCRLGGSKNFFELLKACDLQSPFQDATLATVVQQSSDWIKNFKK